MPRFHVMGIDMSLRAAGFVAVSRTFGTNPYEGGPDGILARVRAAGIKTRTFGIDLGKMVTENERLDRLIALVDQAVDFYERAGRPPHVAIEEYAFSRSDSHAHALGEAGGGVKVALYQRGARVMTVHVNTARKLLLGVGNLPSAQAKRAVQKAFEAAGFVGLTEAEYDALAVANCKLGDLGLPCFASPPVERKKKGK